MFNFNGMPYKRSGRVGGKSVSMVGMLVLLLAALLVLPSCTGTDTRTVCGEGHELNDEGECVATNPPPPPPMCDDGYLYDTDAGECVAEVTPPMCDEGELYDTDAGECVAQRECADGTIQDPDGANRCIPDPEADYDIVGELKKGQCHSGSDSPDMIKGTDADECIEGRGGDDVIRAMGGDDDVDGGSGGDMLYGGDGDDKLKGAGGDDELHGEGDDDELTGGSGDNTLDGGEGDDTAIYTAALQVTANLDTGGAKAQHAAAEVGDGFLSLDDDADGGTGVDSLMNIENVKGTPGKDRLDGDGKANRLEGYDEGDVINGGGGNDVLLPNRPAMPNAMGVLEANAADASADPPEVDGLDVVDGGAGIDTISYEGESAAVTIDLSTIIPAITDDPDTTAVNEARIAHVAASAGAGTTAGDASTAGDTDRITVVLNEATEDEDDLISTIENITGGFAGDTLEGDAGDNVLMGGAGADTLTGNGGNDTLNGGPDVDTTLDGGDGDDTYMEVVAAEDITEAATANAGSMDTVHYATLKDDATTAGTDESIVTDTISANVEIVFGTPNVDNLTAAATGVTILGRGGDDVLVGDAGADTLVGCAGEDTLTGGAGNDNFGIFNDGDDPDTITDFATGADANAAADEIHLKGFSGTVTTALIPGNATAAGVYVDGELVAIVASTATFSRAADTAATPPVTALTQAQGILAALGKSNSKGEPIVRTVTFDSAKCM